MTNEHGPDGTGESGEAETEHDAQMEAAWQALESGDVDEARQQAARLDPEMPETMLFMAACAREEGDDAKALALLRKTIAADPDWATPELWLAEILAADGDATAEALRHAARALDLAEEETDFLSAVALKAGLEAELGEADDARRTLEELPPPEVKLGDLELALEIAHLHIALGDPKTARARLRVLSEEHPEVGDVWYALGCAAEDLGDDDEMLAAWKRTWALDSTPRQGRAAEDRLPEAEVAEVAGAALAELPERARDLLKGIPIVVAELPAEADVAGGLDPRALGLFSGTAYADGGTALGGQPGLTQIILFRRNLERAAADEDELRDEIRATLLHETGHFFGLDDTELESLGLG
ncbi:MAG TPA: metallopeptidase family protein [Polyangia bacterium]|nr:metallopeptidase family protein [Polyangia bacterium]